MLEAVIFDMDGVLIDSEPIWQDVEVDVFGALGVPITRDRCSETMGFRVTEVVALWRSRHPWTGPTDAEVETRIMDGVVAAIASRGVPKSGAVEAVAFCRSRVDRLAVCSSSFYRIIDAVLERCGLGHAFAVVHSAEDEKKGKPDPAVYRTTAAKLGVEPARCLAIEDSPHGVASAKAAGMRCLAVPDAAVDVGQQIMRADMVLPSLTDLDDDAWRYLNGE